MRPSLRHILHALLWISAAAYVIYAAAQGRHIRKSRQVVRLDIEIADSSSQGRLVSAARVREWIARSGIPTIGTAVDEVDLTGIEELIARNGFVAKAVAYISYAGVLHVEIRQRKPVVRLLTDGMNKYVTHDGYVFDAPQQSSLYVPVVTGPYRPPFPTDCTGDPRAHIDDELHRIDLRIAELEREKYPFYRRELQNNRNIAALRRMRIKKRWWRLERTEAFEKRVEELRAYKNSLRRSYRYETRLIREGIEAVERKQEEERRRQKNLEKSYEDFMKLLTFVEHVEKNDFWRSEVVQIIARTTPSGALEVDLIPRSGRFSIRFGRLERIDEKFDKLRRFYRSGLPAIGWETYGTIDVRYGNQVVCRK